MSSETVQKAKQILWFCGACVAIVAAASRVAGEDKLVLAPLATNATATSTNSLQKSSADASNLPTLEVAHSVMVTVELGFGPTVPTIAGALQEIERHYDPVDGLGRTFAILDAYGEPTAAGKLHVSMHISAEKAGLGFPRIPPDRRRSLEEQNRPGDKSSVFILCRQKPGDHDQRRAGKTLFAGWLEGRHVDS